MTRIFCSAGVARRSSASICRDAGVAFFMKQMTRKAPIPADLMVREFPSVCEAEPKGAGE